MLEFYFEVFQIVMCLNIIKRKMRFPMCNMLGIMFYRTLYFKNGLHAPGL